jgi:hypothetical protein
MVNLLPPRPIALPVKGLSLYDFHMQIVRERPPIEVNGVRMRFPWTEQELKGGNGHKQGTAVKKTKKVVI